MHKFFGELMLAATNPQRGHLIKCEHLSGANIIWDINFHAAYLFCNLSVQFNQETFSGGLITNDPPSCNKSGYPAIHALMYCSELPEVTPLGVQFSPLLPGVILPCKPSEFNGLAHRQGTYTNDYPISNSAYKWHNVLVATLMWFVISRLQMVGKPNCLYFLR